MAGVVDQFQHRPRLNAIALDRLRHTDARGEVEVRQIVARDHLGIRRQNRFGTSLMFKQKGTTKVGVGEKDSWNGCGKRLDGWGGWCKWSGQGRAEGWEGEGGMREKSEVIKNAVPKDHRKARSVERARDPAGKDHNRAAGNDENAASRWSVVRPDVKQK